MSGFDVDPAELFAARGRVLEAASDGRTELARLDRLADEVLGASWRGAAASAFETGYDDWRDGIRTMLSALDELAAALGLAGHDYEQAEATNQHGLQRMAS